jgi:uncharacterized protein involved in type VI secretion and phage assembly
MKPLGAFATPLHWLTSPKLGKVVSVQDPQSLSRVQVRLHAPDADGEALIWARVAVPYAGDEYGAFLIPGVDAEVLVIFVGDDPAWPVVVGSLWNGATSIPETIGGAQVDRWTLTGKNGTRIAIVEQAQGQEKVEIETPNGVKATLTDASGGSLTLTTGQHTATFDSSGVTIDTSSNVQVNASQVSVTAGQMSVDAAMATFSGVVQCSTLIATSVVGSSYTPGAGNVW